MDARQVIETGVDKLVELLKSKGKMSFRDAAKELGVGIEVIAEWADFLNEEGILGVEYKFTTPYLIERRISKADLDKKVREFEDKKDIFVRKAEGTVSVLQREAGNMKRIQKEFELLKKDLGIDLDSVRKEILELESLEKAKQQLSAKLLEGRRDSEKKEEEIKSLIARERKMYEQLLGGVATEESSLQSQKNAAVMLKKKENALRAEIATIRGIAKEIEERMDEESNAISGSERHIERLKAMAEEIRGHMEKEKESLKPLIMQKDEHEKSIRELQQTIVKKISGMKNLEEEGVSKRLRDFFQKKMKVSLLVEKLNEDRGALEKDLTELVRKAKVFQLTSRGKNLDEKMKDIEAKFQEMEKRKGTFEEGFKKLFNLIRTG